MTTYSGHFFDGQTAKKHSVAVELGLDNLTIRQVEGTFSVHWPIPDLRAVRKLRPGQPAELTCNAAPDARLVIDDPAFAETILEQASHLGKRRGYTARWWERPVTVTVAVLAFVGVVIFAVPWLAGPIARTVPDSWRTALGSSTEELILSIGSQCTAPAGARALDKLVTSLQPRDGRNPANVKVIKLKMINALALPGGRIVVMDKLLDLMETPDQLAAVLAHEMGHVAQRHPTEAAIRATGFSLFLTMLIGGSSQAAELLASLGVQMVESSYTRDDERAADRIAANLMKAAGADGSALGQTFARLQKAEEKITDIDLGRLGALLSTHPPFDERIAASPRTPDYPTRPLLTDTEWQALKNICAGEKSGGGDEVGEQSVDVRGLFHVDHMAGAVENVPVGVIG